MRILVSLSDYQFSTKASVHISLTRDSHVYESGKGTSHDTTFHIGISYLRLSIQIPVIVSPFDCRYTGIGV